MDELEQAVLCSFNPNTNEQIKTKAIAYCNSVRDAPNGWVYCLDKLFKSPHIEVKFFCLSVFQDVILHRYNSLTDTDRSQFKSGLWSFLTDHISSQQIDTALKNKYAHILALLIKVEYPSQWPSFFTDLLNTLSNAQSIDIFLRIMQAIDEEVVSRDVQRSTAEIALNTQIKDYMREHHIKLIVGAWYRILVSNPSVECLENVRRYISWIDINLIVNDTWLPVMVKFLGVTALREKACECFQEIVKKGMDPTAKLALINKLQLTSLLSNIAMDDDVDYLETVAMVINTIGVEILTSLEKLKSTDTLLLESALNLLWRYLNHPEDDVSIATFEFALSYVNSLKNVQLSAKHGEHLGLMLQIIRNRLRYHDNYDFTNPTEDHAEIREYRQELLNIYKAIFRLTPQMVAQFVHSTLSAAIQNFDQLSFTDIEASLQLLYVLGEEVSIKNMEGFYAQMIALIAGSKLSTYPHPAVALIYFDVIVRYAKFLPGDPEVLKNILISFLDGRGVRHPHATVRSRVCYLFQRIIKSQLAQFAPFFSSILQSLKEFLIISIEIQKIVSFEDQTNLFDALGSLIASQPNAQDQRKYLEEVLTPLIKQGQDILTGQLYTSDTPEKPVYTTMLLQIITAIGTTSKGFSGQTNPEIVVDFKQSLDFVLLIYQSLSKNEEIRSKTIFFLHRMVECLGQEMLPFIGNIVVQMLSICGVKDLCDLIRLINQFMSKFKEKMYQPMDEIWMKVVERIYQFISQLSRESNRVISGPMNDIERDIVELLKTYYLLLSNLVTTNLTNVLRSPTNAPHLNQVLKTVLDGCANTSDITAVKSCYQIMRKLIEQWIEGMPGFSNFVMTEAMPVMMKQPFKPDFDLSDAGTMQVVQEFLQIQQILFTKLGKQFSEYMRASLVTLQCPPQVAEQYIQVMESGNLKQFKTFFMQFVGSYKKRPS